MALKKAYTDGACRGGNPGFTSCAWVLYEGEKEIAFGTKYLGPVRQTNNYAEYQGIITLLEYLYTAGIRNVIIHCDSQLVVNQTLGNWAINQDELRGYAAQAYGLLTQGCHVLKHIKGHSGDLGNERADQLCNITLDQNTETYAKSA